jgi:hypothetical protein
MKWIAGFSAIRIRQTTLTALSPTERSFRQHVRKQTHSEGQTAFSPAQSLNMRPTTLHRFIMLRKMEEQRVCHLFHHQRLVSRLTIKLGDGSSDDTGTLNTIFSTQGTNIIYFPAGVYVVTDTVFIPAGTRVVGEAWSQIMASGSKFQDINTPYVMVRVGGSGDAGDVEVSDMLFTTKGATAGAVLLEWNIGESSQGSAGMWDAHFRIGGAAGTGLQASDCPTLAGVNDDCIAGAMLMHVTSSSSGSFENVWAWISDHDIDDPINTQVSVYVARGRETSSSSC